MGYAGFDSGDFYSDYDGEVKGVNDSNLNPFGFYFPMGTEINYFIKEGLAIGGSIHYSKHVFPGDTDVDMILCSVRPSLYYYMNFNGRILPYVMISYCYSKLKTDDDSLEYTLRRIPVGAGVTVMAGKYLGVFGQLTYTFDQYSVQGSDTQDGRVANFKVGINAFF